MKLVSNSLVFVLIFINEFSYAQYIQNQSFEGTPSQNQAPNNWFPCNEYSTPDTQPGYWEVINEASDGNTYIGLVTRGNLGPYANNNEAVGTTLLKPFLKGKTYHLSIDLSYSEQWGHFIDFGPNFLFYNTPAKLKVYGGNGSCAKTELLWESPEINHLEWKSYTLSFTPSHDIYHFTLEAAYINDSTYFGNVLIDNLRECSINLNLVSDTTICDGNSILVDATIPNGQYLWQDGSKDPLYTLKDPGHYSVKVSNQCVNKLYEISVKTRNCICDTISPIQITGFDTLICDSEPITLDISIPDGSYHWENGSKEAIRSIHTPGSYIAEISNVCDTVTTYFNIQFMDCNCNVEVPNVFTPNGDGINEVFKITGSPSIARYEMNVYNRWGNLVFQSNEINEYWDGKDAPSGVYYWTIKLMCIIGDTIEDDFFADKVTIIK